MNKKIEDYLHLYIGCTCWIQGQVSEDPLRLVGVSKDTDEPYTLWCHFDSQENCDSDATISDVKPILRKLDSITKEEMSEVETYKHEGEWVTDYAGNMAESSIARVPIIDMAKTTHYLLSKHFDLFGLIDAGLAIASPSPNTLPPSTPNT